MATLTPSDALKRVQKFKKGEGIYLSLDQLETLVNYLRNDPNATAQYIGHVAFMIGQTKQIKDGKQKVQRTVEVLPFKKTDDVGGTFMTGTSYSGETIEGYLTIPDFPINNSDGGGGGNQKTPPPSTN